MGVVPLLTIDGSYGEGGGQILRNALALSMISGRGIRIENIRANRTQPGLRPQHLTALRSAGAISRARIEGGEIGSLSIEFIPEKIVGGEFSFDIGTAGSVTLLLQCLLPPLLTAEKESFLILKGGTDVPWSPPMDYLHYVFLPLLKKMGINVDLDLAVRGFYPRGGGEIRVTIPPCSPDPVDFLSTGEEVTLIEGRAFLSNLPEHISCRMIRAAGQELRTTLGKELEVRIEECVEPGIDAGTGITLWSGKYDQREGEGEIDGRTLIRSIKGASSLGKRGVKAEDVGREAAKKLIEELEIDSGVDIHAADQLPVFAPLVNRNTDGKHLHYSVREITPHLRTALWVLKQFGHYTTTLYLDGFHIML